MKLIIRATLTFALFVFVYLVLAVENTSAYLPDGNQDGYVTASDALLLLNNYGKTTTNTIIDGDYFGNGKVGALGFATWRKYFGNTCSPMQSATSGAYYTHAYRNMFSQIGKSQSDVDARLNTIMDQFLYGKDDVDPASGNWGGERLYYPIGTDMAVIKAPDSGDVLVEGIHSFLLYLVEFNRKTEFDRLWKWAKTYMQYQSGDWKGYFAWQLKPDGTILGATPASGSEPFIATALFFAAHRWGNGTGIYNYENEAQMILDTEIHKEDQNGGIVNGVTNAFTWTPWGPIINFVPYYGAAESTGSSYPTAAFYRLWQLWDKDVGDRSYWVRATTAAREFWKRAANPTTGLPSERTEFSGIPRTQEGRDYYGHDNWFTHSNISIDSVWFAECDWEKTEMAKLQSFFSTQNPVWDHYTLDGQPFSQYSQNAGHLSAITGGQTAIPENSVSQRFVQNLWDSIQPTGQWRFSTGLLYMMGWMEAGGYYRIW